MPEVAGPKYEFSITWWGGSDCPSLGQVLEYLCRRVSESRSEDFFSPLDRAGIAFSGKGSSPEKGASGNSIIFYAATIAEGIGLADVINAALISHFTLHGTNLYINGKSPWIVLQQLDEGVRQITLELKQTRRLFRNSVIAQIRRRLEAAPLNATGQASVEIS